jgi:MoxR-like ATPase
MTATVCYLDEMGIQKESTWTDVFASCKKIDDYFNVYGLRYFERDDVLKKMKYALLMREHVLIVGPTGAAKSRIINGVFSGITGARVWSMDLTKTTSDVHLYGNYDVREMQTSGKMVHMTDDTFADAHFAKMGEFFDASDWTLRSALGALNEREIRLGPQFKKLPLLTVVADTNFEPEQFPQRRAMLDAVVDRFLFRTRVAYVEDPVNRYNMLDLELSGNYTKLPELTLQDIVLVSGVVKAMNLLNDRYVKEAYQELTYNYSKERVKAGRNKLSDRRYIAAAQIMEVCALLNGRTEVTFEDLKISRHVLAAIPEDEKLLEDARTAAIQTWVERAKKRDIDAELFRLKEMTGRMVEFDFAPASLEEVKRHLAEVEKLRSELTAFKPNAIEVRKLAIDAISRLNDRRLAGEFAIVDKLIDNAPVCGENTPKSELGPMMEQAQRIRDELMAMTPGSEKANIRHREALVQVMTLMADLETEFHGNGKKP